MRRLIESIQSISQKRTINFIWEFIYFPVFYCHHSVCFASLTSHPLRKQTYYIWFQCVCGSENNDSNEKKNTGSIVANNNTFNLIAYKLRINEFLIQPNDHNIFLVLIQMVHNWCCARIQEIVNVLLWLTTAIGKGWWITGGIVIPVIK